MNQVVTEAKVELPAGDVGSTTMPKPPVERERLSG